MHSRCILRCEATDTAILLVTAYTSRYTVYQIGEVDVDGRKSAHFPCRAWCRKCVSWIRCKCNQNLERTVAPFSRQEYLIAGSVAEGDDTFRIGVGVCSNELEGVVLRYEEILYGVGLLKGALALQWQLQVVVDLLRCKYRGLVQKSTL